MVSYLLRRFIKLSLSIIVIFFLPLGLCQLDITQHFIVSRFFPEISFRKIEGFLPFNFCIYDLTFKNNDIEINVKKSRITTSRRLDYIKSLDIDSINFIDRTVSKYVSFDFLSTLSMILSQKIIKNLSIENTFYNNKKIGSIKSKINSMKRNTNHNIMIESIYGSFDINNIISQNDNNINANIKYDQKNIINLRCDVEKGDISFDFSRILSRDGKIHPHKIMDFKGKYNDRSIIGKLHSFDISRDIDLNIKSLDNNILDFNIILSKFYDDNNLSLKGSYILDTNKFRIKDVIFGSYMKLLDSFDIDMNQNMMIDNIVGELCGGKFNIEKINLNNIQDFDFKSLSLKNIDLKKIPIKNMKIEGILNGKANHDKKDSIKFDMNINKIFVGDSIKFPDIKLRGTYSSKKLVCEILYDLLKKHNKIDINCNYKDWIIDKNSDISIKGKGRFDILSSLPKIEGHHISGNLKYDIFVRGRLSNPDISGDITLKDGLYANETTGTYLKNITIKSKLKRDGLRIESISGMDDMRKPGYIRGSGLIDFKNGKFLSDINIDIEALSFVDIKQFDGKLYGKLGIKGDLLDGFKITGDLYSKDASVDISDFIRLSSYAIDIVDSIKPEKKKKNKKITKILNIPIDIKFKFIPYLKVVGFGIKSSWNGGIDIISNSISNPKYKGNLSLKDGIIKVSGKNFDLKNGSVSFSDENPGVLFMEVSAVKDLGNFKVGAKFKQDKKGTNVTFFSKPPILQDRDILSYMLFEKNASELSSSEAFTLYAISQNLSGKDNFDFMGKIKSVLGLDTIDIKRHEDDEKGTYSSLSIGKKLGKVNVSIDQGGAADTTKVVVDAEVSKNTKIFVDLSQKEALQAGFAWHKRY